MDDENPTEVTAGAIVTVTVTLLRKDMSALFGDDTVAEANNINENGEETKEGGDAEPETQTNKRPVWLKQKKGSILCLQFNVLLMFMLKEVRRRVIRKKRSRSMVEVLNIKLKNRRRRPRRLKRKKNQRRAISMILTVAKGRVTKIMIGLQKKKLNQTLKTMIR